MRTLPRPSLSPLLAGLLCTWLAPASAADREGLRSALERIAANYLTTRAEPEHISAVSISVRMGIGAENLNVTAGRVSREPNAAPVTPATLFQIGSITKSFTSAALLQLAAEGRVGLDRPLGELLPQYPAWKDLTLRRLLHMTSGIPGYDNAPLAPLLGADVRGMDNKAGELIEQIHAAVAAHRKRHAH